MGLQDFINDAKNILFGNDSGTASIDDFKKEIENAVKSGKLTKAQAAELMQARNNLKKVATSIEKEQINSISLKDGIELSEEEVKAKKEKEEEERKKRERNAQIQNANNQMQNINKEKKDNNTVSVKPPKNNDGKLKIDREKLEKQIEKDERADNNIRKPSVREEKN